MGCIICTGSGETKIIDGQQRLTTLTLLLIYLNNLQIDEGISDEEKIDLNNMIYDKIFNKRTFNINVEEREKCMLALYLRDPNYIADNESSRNLLNRYSDIEQCYPDELKGEALLFFISWLIERVLLLEIDTPSEDEAHTIFLTMNDRGLSLNSAEMMKAFVIQHVSEADRLEVNHAWQNNISQIKSSSGLDSSGVVNAEDVEFISIWLRAKYANSLRESKRGAKDEDYELLGDKFHTWVRDNTSSIGLNRPNDYKSFVVDEMTKVTRVFLTIKEYGAKLTEGFEDVFYNTNRDLNYQTTLILSSIRNDDSEDIIDKKIRMVSKFVDIFSSIRIFNFKKVNWNTNKYLLFNVMKDIRNQDCKTIGMVLVRTLRRMDVQLEGITKLSLNQFTGRYMLHILARFTSYVNTLMGNPSQFEIYVDRNREGNTYDIEHILPDDFDSYSDLFDDPDDFARNRQLVGNLIILTRDKNRSYQEMKYSEKVQHYAGDNILAQAMEETAYTNNPHFLPLVERYGFRAMPSFNKDAISERADLYLRIAADIWDSNQIKELAGGWSNEEENEFFKDEKAQEFTFVYANRSWSDALKYGFLSANESASGKTIYNVREGDVIYCYITGKGFVGIGECTSTAIPMSDFTVLIDGNSVSVEELEWEAQDNKDNLDRNKELFIGVRWKKYVESIDDAYWEKGLKTVPLVAHKLSDRTTYKKIIEHFEHSDRE